MHSQNQNRMSACNIPFEMQSEIIKRVLPVKSLLRFRSVSKQWKSLIDSSEFITDHSVNQANQNHLLVRYKADSEYKYVSIPDDDTFLQNNVSPVVPPTVNLVSCLAQLLDSSHGLVCLYGYVNKKIMIVIWNPSIRKSVGIEVSDTPADLGFGVCPKTIDPKIVMFTRLFNTDPIMLKAEVFTLSSRAWRSTSTNIHLSERTCFKFNRVVVDEVIYFATYDASMESRDRIITFNLVSEEFGEIDLPDSLARAHLMISKFNKSLVVLHYGENNDAHEVNRCDVWMMIKNGFEKLFSVGVQSFHNFNPYGIVGFRRNGQPIRKHRRGENGSLVTTLEAYDPLTKHTCDLGVYVNSHSMPMVTSYTELLLLNNHSNDIIQE